MTAALDEHEIHEILADALLSGRLGFGAKLGEQKLAAIFGVTRERIRKVLHRLGHERLIDVVPNRGAFVANPGLEDAREIYEARRAVEGGIAWQLAGQLSAEQLKALRKHFGEEQQAHRKGNRADRIRLSGAFHIMLAAMTRNAFLVRQMQELVSRTSMLVAIFEEDTAQACGIDEHASILRALEAGDPPAATRAMVGHLSLIETRLHARPLQARSVDLDDALRAGMRRRASRSRGGQRKTSPPAVLHVAASTRS